MSVISTLLSNSPAVRRGSEARLHSIWLTIFSDMVSHMKTTIDLPDELVGEVKELARASGTTMRELMVDGLRSEIERRRNAAPRPDFVFRTVGGDGLQPGIDARDFTRLAYDLP